MPTPKLPFTSKIDLAVPCIKIRTGTFLVFDPMSNEIVLWLALKIPSVVPSGLTTFNDPPNQPLPPTPMPPFNTRNAPVIVLIAIVGLLIVKSLLIVPPEKLLIVAAVIIGLPLIQPAVPTFK